MKAKMLVAVLGTGKMGTAMARRLDEAGFELRLWNRTRERADAVGVGTVCETPGKTAAGVDVVLSSLTGPSAVEDVYLRAGGALETAKAQVYVDLSTIGPAASHVIAEAARDKGVGYVEAPVLGNLQAAESGRLVCLVGGLATHVDRARPVLEALGEVRHVGGIGSGSRLKLLANTELALVNLVGAELLAAGTRLGFGADVVWPILTRLVPYLDSRRSGFVDQTYSPATFRLQDMVKDLTLALDVYAEQGCDVPLTSLAAGLFERAAVGHADDDMSAVTALWRDREVR